MERHLIHADNLERLEKKLATIEKKCNKNNYFFHYQNLGPKFIERENENGEKEVQKYFEVECWGQVKHSNWEFIATIDPHAEGNVIRAYNTEIEIPVIYQTSDCTCDHCHTRRSRKNTYILHNSETDEWKQVGSNCLKEFTNGLDAELVAHYIALFDEMIKGEAPYSGSASTRYYERNHMLEIAKECVNKFGYFNSDAQRSTKVRTLEYYNLKYAPSRLSRKDIDIFNKEIEDADFSFESEENKHFVEEAIKWIASTEDTSNYMNNLRLICKSEFLTFKDLGFLVSLVPTYEKHLGDVARSEKRESARALEAASSNHVGSTGNRITIKPDEITLVSSWENVYGVTHLYKIVENGNVFMWYASTTIDNDKEVESIVGTIKEHTEYNGVKQTILTRCKVSYKPIIKDVTDEDPTSFMEQLMECI